jgi:hypothetical protein
VDADEEGSGRARTATGEGGAGARAEALVEALEEALAHGVVQLAAVLRVARETVRAVELAEVLMRGEEAEVLAEVKVKVLAASTSTPVTYGEVLADSKLKAIIDSIGADHRHSLARDLRGHSNTVQEYWWFIQAIVPITRLPQEFLEQILLIIIDNASCPPLAVMLVCKNWYNIVTGIWVSLNLGTKTPKPAVTSKLEKNQSLLDISVDTEIDRSDLTPSESPYEAIFTAMETISRWRTFIIETFPAKADLPEHLVNRCLQRSSDAVMSRLRVFKIKSACEMSPLLDRLLRILGTTASGELTTVEINSANVISVLVPMYSSIFHSITSLSLNTPGSRNPVDLLPHLHHLEALTATHLSLPTYHNDVNLPFVHTLRYLRLRAVSIQWMSGRTFHALESCALLFPPLHHIQYTFSTNLPNCKDLTFQGYPLDILDGVSVRKLTHLSVMCSSLDKPQGTRQLIRFSSQALCESRLAPRILHISIEATGQAWTKALASMSSLEELVIDNAQPSSLGVEALQPLIVYPVHATNLGTTSTPGGWNTPACPLLKRFGLRYRRWLRPSEHFDLLLEFMSIIWSRQLSNSSLQSFRVWTGSDQKESLELIEGSRISFKGFERLANDDAFNGENLLQLVVSRLLRTGV